MTALFAHHFIALPYGEHARQPVRVKVRFGHIDREPRCDDCGRVVGYCQHTRERW